MGRQAFGVKIVEENTTMILVDTSVIVAWLDRHHPQHENCADALNYWAGQTRLAVSAVTYAELAAGGRSQEAINEDLALFDRFDLDFNAAWNAGHAFARTPVGKTPRKPVLPDYLIRGQAKAAGCRHLTCDRRRLSAFPEVEFLFPQGPSGR
jgi:predicted nucleic acid-binding protein